MPARRGGDRKPPDNLSELEKNPEIGFVYKIDKKVGKGAEYILISNIVPANEDPHGRVFLEMKRWSPRNKEWVEYKTVGKSEGRDQTGMTLQVFVNRIGKHDYTLAFDSVEKFEANRGIGQKSQDEEVLILKPEDQVVPQQDEEPTLEELKVNKGDFIRWKDQDTDQFDGAREVIDITDDPKKGKQVFVEGIKEGIPILDITVVIAAAPTEPKIEVEDNLTPEQKKRLELGSRLGLSPEQLKERETLEAEVDRTRAEYVKSLYEHEQSMMRVMSILSLKKKVDPDAQYKEEYDRALESLRQFDTEHLQARLAKDLSLRDTTHLSEDEQKEQKALVPSYLERYMRLEATALWSLQQDIRAAHKEGHLEKMGGWRKTILEKAGKIVKNYEQLSWPKKLAIGGTLFVGHMGLAAISGPAAVGLASLWLGAKMVTGAAAYKGASKAAESGAQWLGDKVGGVKERREIKKIGELFQEGTDRGEYYRKLNEVTRRHVLESDKKLQSYERRSVMAKVGAMALIFGAPVARYLGDIFGSTDAVSSANTSPQGANVEGNGSVPAGEAPLIIQPEHPSGGTPTLTPDQQTPGGGGGAPAGESASAAPALEAVTVTEAHGSRGLWGIISSQLPENLSEPERNRVTGALQNLIRTKLEGLTDAEIQERYGLSSRDINFIQPGDNIRLNELVSHTELQQIISGNEVSASAAPVAPDAVASAERPSAVPGPETAEQREVRGYSSNVIGFGSRPLTPEEQYWRDVRSVQGNAVGVADDGLAPGGGDISEAGGPNRLEDIPGYNAETGEVDEASLEEYNSSAPENSETPTPSQEGGRYTVEMSDYRQLLQDPTLEGRNLNIPVLQRESVTLLNQELWDIDNTELGPDYQFNNWTMRDIENRYNGRPIGELLSFNNNQYNYDPRIQYRENQLEWPRNRTVQLPPIRPYPTLSDGPDVNAIATMDQVASEYRRNIGSMTEAAIRTFGSAAMPQNTLEHRETVREYMMRIATLYTRARIENPNFRLNF